MLYDFQNIVGITVTNKPSRIPMLIAAMSCILTNVRNFTWYLKFQHDDYGGIPFEMMKQMGKINDNWVGLESVDENLSVGAIKNEFIIEQFMIDNKEAPRYVFNIDDDMLFSAESLKYISQCTMFRKESFYIVNQFDVDDRRGFADYDDKIRKVDVDWATSEELNDFIQGKGERVIAHHLWRLPEDHYGLPFLIPVRAMSSGWIVDKNEYVRYGVSNVLEKWPKGKRGYDVAMCLEFVNRGCKPLFIVPTRGYHIGLEGNYYNDDWEEHKHGIKEQWEEKDATL